jgi:HK97 gp10 family phage protein
MVTGVEQLRRRLVDALPEQTRAQLEIAMTESAALIAAGARLRVPVETGELRDTIHTTDVREGKRGGLYVAITAGKRTPNNYNTARIVEFGTIDTPAQPFLLPSYRANRKRSIRRMRKAITDAIRKEHLDGR